MTFANPSAASRRSSNPNAASSRLAPHRHILKRITRACRVNTRQSTRIHAVRLDQQGANNHFTCTYKPNQPQVHVFIAQAAIKFIVFDASRGIKQDGAVNSTPTGASSTVGDVIGRQSIPSANYQQLAGTLPYATVQTGQLATSIPASLQHRFSYQVNDQYGQELLSYNERVAQINGKRLTLSYIPATQADADTIASYLPKANADGSPIRPNQLPTSLPGYLIRLKPQINLDGQAVATSAQAVQMGSDLPSSGGFTSQQNIASWDITTDGSNVAGQATAIGISAGGISAAQLNNLKTRLQTTQTSLQVASSNPLNATALLANITGEQISGDLLTATIWSWFAAAESHNRLSQNQAGMVEVPALSYGLFHAVAQPIYSWGIVRQVKFPGVNLDIGHVRNISWSNGAEPANDENKWIAYNRLRGQYMSALEHAIPERFFNDPAQCNTEGSTPQTAGLPVCPQGISAVKALALAAAQGQKIYTITRQVYNNNPSIVSQKLSAHSIDTRQRVQQYLDAGAEVTIHEAPITQSGWSGAGYTAIDPQTGAGGYLIDGGSNGGVLLVKILAVIFAFLGVTLTLLAGASVAAATWPFAALAFFAGCLVDPTSRTVFQTSLFAFGVNLIAMVLFNPALFAISLLISSVFLALAFYGVLAKPDDSRLTCRLIGLG